MCFLKRHNSPNPKHWFNRHLSMIPFGPDHFILSTFAIFNSQVLRAAAEPKLHQHGSQLACMPGNAAFSFVAQLMRKCFSKDHLAPTTQRHQLHPSSCLQIGMVWTHLAPCMVNLRLALSPWHPAPGNLFQTSTVSLQRSLRKCCHFMS